MPKTLSKMDHNSGMFVPCQGLVYEPVLLGSKTCPTEIIPSFWLAKFWNPTKEALCTVNKVISHMEEMVPLTLWFLRTFRHVIAINVIFDLNLAPAY